MHVILTLEIDDSIGALVEQHSGDRVLADFEAIWNESGDSQGARFDRDELYAERLDRDKR